MQQIRRDVRHICVVSGSRADYGLLKTLMREIQTDSQLVLQTIVTGMHLAPEFGFTISNIRADGFQIDEEIDSLLAGDSANSIAKSVGLGMIGFADALKRLKPDILVVLGDRFEILAAASAAMLMRIPLAHIHGGEVTEGAVDESIRHAITKMSHMHFTSTEEYRQRVIQLGENPQLVWNVGAPGLDLAAHSPRLGREKLARKLNFNFREQNMLVTFHPETLSEQSATDSIREVLKALEYFVDFGLVFTMPNADAAGRQLANEIRGFVSRHAERAILVESLGEDYFSMIEAVDLVVGNSSSGLIEVPFFHRFTVNIGDRQKGRLKATSVLDCACRTELIQEKILEALNLNKQASATHFQSPYGIEGASKRIKNQLEKVDLKTLKTKPFHDLTQRG